MGISHRFLGVLLSLFLFTACQNNHPSIVDLSFPAPTPAPVPLPAPVERPVSYTKEIKPLIESKCLSCHSCFDAPCQLKLESTEGLERGAFHESIYGGARTEAMPPTRLGIDETTVSGWRERGFYSVLDAENGQSQPLLLEMISLAKQFPFPPNGKLPDTIELGITRKNQCVSNDKFPEFAHKFPWSGMPFAVTGLSDEEYALLAGWIRQGAVISEEPVMLTGAEKWHIQQWETLLNRSDKRGKLVARWLYEHLFMAFLYFSEIKGEPRFFEVLRSSTPAGKDIEPIATVNPNDDPKVPFFYRLRPITGNIVHKRRINYPLSQAKLQRINELFFKKHWQVRELPGYGYTERANPFVTFADMPASSRYQFMLDDAEYFIRTFIHGPVCRGQIATDVIRDHFWIMFQDPKSDLFVTDAPYQRKTIPLLGMPGQDDDLLTMGENWLRYLGKHMDYSSLRQNHYTRVHPQGAALNHIWNGDDKNKNALLTIFRHHNSASVVRGWVGDEPQTLWLMDYPLLERTYYELVVNYDVYGNVAHQVLTRLYFDLIRNSSEHNFLRFLPAGQRKAQLDDWYQDLGKLKFGIFYEDIDDISPSQEEFVSDNPKHELVMRMLERFGPVNEMAQDRLNRCKNLECSRSDEPAWIQRVDQALSTIAARPASELSGILQLPEVTFVRVRDENDNRVVYTLLRDRAHSNVAFMLGERLRYQSAKDRLTVFPGITGSYPNFIFDVPDVDIEEFVSQLAHVNKSSRFEQIVNQWGVRRTHPYFWEILHDITAWQKEYQPLLSGIFDINRYENF